MYDWFGKDWPKLKKQVIMLSVSYSSLLFEDGSSADSVSPHGVEQFSSTLQAVIRKPIIEDDLGMWKDALPLFTFFDLLTDVFNRDLSSLSKKESVSFEQALGQNLRYYFEDAKREMVAAEIGGTPSRLKTRDRLDRLSREVAEQIGTTERCTEKHFETLLSWINEKFKNNYNHPHKLKTIQGLVFKLSKVCRNLLTQVDSLEIERYSKSAMAASVSSVLFGKLEQEVLYESLSELKDEEFELLSHNCLYLL